TATTEIYTLSLHDALPIYLRPKVANVASSTLAKGATAFVGLIYLQMLLGALVAGLHAGLIYNTWPSMDGRFMPEDAFVQRPSWINFFENAGTAQFDHRIGAYIVALSVLPLWWRERRRKLTGFARRSSNALLHITLFQIVLGIVTLLLQAPEALAAAHQLTAALLLCTAVWHAFEMRNYDAIA